MSKQQLVDASKRWVSDRAAVVRESWSVVVDGQIWNFCTNGHFLLAERGQALFEECTDLNGKHVGVLIRQCGAARIPFQMRRIDVHPRPPEEWPACDECLMDGRVFCICAACEDQHEAVCPACDGWTVVRPPRRVLEVGGHNFDARYLAEICEFMPEAVRADVIESAKGGEMLALASEDKRACLMRLRTTDFPADETYLPRVSLGEPSGIEVRR